MDGTQVNQPLADQTEPESKVKYPPPLSNIIVRAKERTLKPDIQIRSMQILVAKDHDLRVKFLKQAYAERVLKRQQVSDVHFTLPLC